jgi:predicted DNA-binding protein with PD1-like motif
MPDVQTLPLRLRPGADLRAALEAEIAARSIAAAFVASGIGSLGPVCLRFAGQKGAAPLAGNFELLTLAGTLAVNGSHLHASVSDAAGRVLGGHVARGCIVRTTVEVLLVVLPEWSLAREHDAATGFPELVVRPARRMT